jgi:hypothetical protein
MDAVFLGLSAVFLLLMVGMVIGCEQLGVRK